MNNLTNNQQELVNQLINEFTKINKANEPSEDIFAYIDGAIDSKRKLREELTAKNKVYEQIFMKQIGDVMFAISPIMKKYGYSIDYECIDRNDMFSYCNFTLLWGLDSYGRKIKNELFLQPRTIMTDGILHYEKSDFIVQDSYYNVNKSWRDIESLKKHIADEIIYRLKRNV